MSLLFIMLSDAFKILYHSLQVFASDVKGKYIILDALKFYRDITVIPAIFNSGKYLEGRDIAVTEDGRSAPASAS